MICLHLDLAWKYCRGMWWPHQIGAKAIGSTTLCSLAWKADMNNECEVLPQCVKIPMWVLPNFTDTVLFVHSLELVLSPLTQMFISAVHVCWIFIPVSTSLFWKQKKLKTKIHTQRKARLVVDIWIWLVYNRIFL